MQKLQNFINFLSEILGILGIQTTIFKMVRNFKIKFQFESSNI